MQRLLGCLLVCCSLTGCVFFKDVQSDSTPLDPPRLAERHLYTPTTRMPETLAWWHAFHDPQLNALIQIALQDSPDMKMATARVKQAEQLTKQAASALWPSIDSNGYVQREKFSEFGLVPPPFNGGTFTIGDLALNFNYEFDFWGKNRKNVSAKLNEQFARNYDLAEAQLILSAAVANTYFQLLSTRKQISIAKTRWEVNQRILEIAENRKKQGIESLIPVHTTRSDSQAAKLILTQYQQAEMVARNQLAILMGKNPFTTEFVTKPFYFKNYNVALPNALPAHLLARRPDISAAKSRTLAAADQIKVAKALFFPDINLSALLSFQGVGLNYLFKPQSTNNAVTGAFDLPIFDAGARRANLGEKYAEFDLAVNAYNQTILNALHEVADNLVQLNSITTQLTAENIAFHSIERNYHLYQSRYQNGITDALQVLQSKQILTQNQAIQVDLQARYLQTVVAMVAALGGNDLIKQG